MTLDFTCPHPELARVQGDQLRKVVVLSFQQRRKMLRQSLKELLKADNLQLPEKWGALRPEQLKPVDFIRLTIDLYGEAPPAKEGSSSTESRKYFESELIWRKSLYGKAGSATTITE